MSKVRVVWVLLLALVLGLAAGSASTESVSRPSWSPGDFWTYRTSTTLAAGFNLTGEATSTMQGTQPVSLGGTTVAADRLILRGAGTASGRVTTGNATVPVTGNWVLTGEELLEPTNLQVIYSLVDLRVNGTYEYVVPFSLRVQNTTTFEILANGWTYPLLDGGRGDVVAAYNFTQDVHSTITGAVHTNGTGQWILHYAMNASESVSTPAGSFSAHPVTETWPDGSSQRTFYAAAAGNTVRTESYGSDGKLVATSVLTAYRYQAAEPATFLGLTMLQWTIALAVAGVALGAAAVLWRRFVGRRHQRPPDQGGQSPPPDLTSGPRGP